MQYLTILFNKSLKFFEEDPLIFLEFFGMFSSVLYSTIYKTDYPPSLMETSTEVILEKNLIKKVNHYIL